MSKNVGEVLVTIDSSWSDLTRGNETKQERARRKVASAILAVI